MAIGLSPFRAVLYATVLAFLLSFLDPKHRMTPVKVGEALAAGARAVLPVAATCAAAGIIVAVVTLTGLGLNLSGIIIDVAGGSLFLCALLAAVAVLLLGLAVPVTASFIIAAVIVSPALTKLGVEPLAAYMFIFYYAVLSEVSPPTALSAVAAAAITGGNAFRTMMLTWKYTLPAFLVPFAFVLTDNGEGLLLQGSVGTVLLAFAVSALAVAGLAVATGAWLLGPARIPERVLCGAAGIVLLYLEPLWIAIGLGLLAARRRRPPRGAASGAERAAQRRGVARAALGEQLGDAALERHQRRLLRELALGRADLLLQALGLVVRPSRHAWASAITSSGVRLASAATPPREPWRSEMQQVGGGADEDLGLGRRGEVARRGCRRRWSSP